MKYIVTGGAGFIGSTLTSKLTEEGNDVTVIDDFSLGSAENIKIGTVVKTSIKQIEDKVDGVFHLGMPSSSPMYRQNHRHITQVVADGVEILDYCVEKKTPLVFASTSSLYNGLTPPFREGDNVSVTDFYTEARYSLERIAEAYTKICEAKVTALRLFSVYGANERHKGEYANLVSQFIWAMKRHESPLIYGDGTQTRDFVWVDDIVNCFTLAMEKINEMPDRFTVINVGTGAETSLNELVNKINTEMGTHIQPKYKQNPIKNYVSRTRADTTRMNHLLSPIKFTPLNEGIDRIIQSTSAT